MEKRVMDGSSIKALVEDREAFAKYVLEKFRALDKGRDGQLSSEELQPVVLAIGSALGLPPKGSSKEADHIYDEVLAEFVRGGAAVTKDEFGRVLRDMLLGVADGLEREPVWLLTLDGRQLEAYASSPAFEVDAVAAFSQALQGTSGSATSMNAEPVLRQALTKVPLQQGMPPAYDRMMQKDVVEPCLEALRRQGINLDKRLSQDELLDAYRKILDGIASRMREKPVTVAHSEKSFDGSTISTFLTSKLALQRTLDDTWRSLVPTVAKHRELLPKQRLRLGLDLVAPFAGLPPLGAVEEMDHVIDESFKLVNIEEEGMVNKEEFCKCMLEVLGGIMLQLQGKPISVACSVVANDKNYQDCLKL